MAGAASETPLPVTTLDEDSVAVLLVTNPGVEDIVHGELLEGGFAKEVEVHCSPWGLRGFVAISKTAVKEGTTVEELCTRLLRLHSVHDVLQFHDRFELPPTDRSVEEPPPEDFVAPAIERLCEYLTKSPRGVPTLAGAESFRVTCDRVGAHEFRSYVLEREVGSVLQQRYGVKGNMKHPAVTVRVDVVLRTAVVATQFNPDRVSRRHKTAFVHKSSINPVVAYTLLRLANIQPGTILLDPFCGGATILCEAAQLYGPNIQLFGSDLNKKVLEGAKGNCEGIEGITFAQCNGRLLHKHYAAQSIDAIVTNLPWGVRVAADANVTNIYKGFLWASWQILRPGGVLVLLVLTVMCVLEEARRTGLWEIEHARTIKTGDMLPSILVLRRKKEDSHWQALTNQRRELTRYTQARTGKKAKVEGDVTHQPAEEVEAEVEAE